MKIAEVVSTFPPYHGGMGNVAFHYSRQLAELGHQVAVFTVKTGVAERDDPRFRVCRLIPWLRYGNAGLAPQLLWKLRDFEVIHLHYPFFGGDIFPALIRRLATSKKTRLIITYHMDVIGAGWAARYLAWHTKYLLPWVLSSADRVFVNSEDYARSGDLQDLFERRPDLFQVVPLGVDLTKYYPSPKNQLLIAKHQIEPREKILLFVAALDSAHGFKGLPQLLQALRRLDSHVRLLVIGDGDRRSTYEQSARDLGIKQRVEFLGRVDDDQLLQYYNLCDLFVLPSTDKTEAFGLVFLEAMACGKPVVGPRLAGVRTVIDDGRTGFLVEPGDIDDLTDKLKAILENDALAAEFGQAGLRKAREKYSWPTIVGQISQVLHELKAD